MLRHLLLRRRLDLGLSRVSVASAAGLNTTTIRSCEQGRTIHLKEQTFAALADALDLPESSLRGAQSVSSGGYGKRGRGRGRATGPTVSSSAPTSRARWLCASRDEIDAAWLRGDARANVLQIAEIIAGSADKATLLSRPSYAKLTERTGLSKRTVQRWARWLEGADLLHVLHEGATSELCAGLPFNMLRTWILTIPAEAAP